jgi:hypothetical protein
MRKHNHGITDKPKRSQRKSRKLSDPPETDERPIRARELSFFWISLGIFLLTWAIVAIAYCCVMTWPGGGEAGFAVIGAVVILSMIATAGTVVSIVFSCVAIQHSKGTIALLMIEIIALGYSSIIYLGFHFGAEWIPLPVW